MHMHCKQPLWELGRIGKRQAARLFDSVIRSVRAKSLCVSHTNSARSCGRKLLRGGRGFRIELEVKVKLTAEGFGFPTETVPAGV